MITDRVTRIVDTCRRHPWPLALATLLLAVVIAWYTAGHLGMNTDVDKLISPDLPWRQREAAFDQAFPQTTNLLVIVIDGEAADYADDAAQALTERLSGRPDLFRTVRRPDGSPFFARNGALFLPVTEVQQLADQLIAAQPLLGSLAADPSLGGLLDTLDLAIEGIRRGETGVGNLDKPLASVADTVEGWLKGGSKPLAWSSLLTGRKPTPEELRRFVLAQPVLNYEELSAGASATEFVRQSARELGLTPDRGVLVRLTGPIALSDEEFATVAQGARFSTALSVTLVTLILFLALRSVRLIIPILATLAAGLVATAGFAAVTVGTLNPISIAFAVMFVGIAVDFGIQFTVRYRDERFRDPDPERAMVRTARGISGPLMVAAATTAAGFLSFLPTAYVGVSQLGLIAGAGMIIAVILNLTVLPALLTVMRPRPERSPVGFAALAGLDRWLLEHRRAVGGAAVLLALVGIALLPFLRFDFNPMNLRDPHTESVATILDLMSDPQTTPYTIDVLRPTLAAATELAPRLERLPEVAQALYLTSFVPEDQTPKLAILSDANLLLGPTLNPVSVKPPPDAATLRAALGKIAGELPAAGPPGIRLAEDFRKAADRPDPDLLDLNRLLTGSLPRRLEALRLMLSAEPVTLETLPDDIRRDWVAADGRARISVTPKGDTRDNDELARFVDAVLTVAPDATGAPISIRESARTIVGSFIQAGTGAIVAITALLFAVLRRVRDTALVVGPLLLGALLTAIACVVLDLPINYANIIALPLLLGIGTAFSIYYVMNWRAGHSGPLQSSTTRAVIFSALLTGSSFGSLALSHHPGTASMGLLLSLSLGLTLLTTLFFLPALLGPPPHKG